jgi:dihydroneopterin aldolase
MNMPTSIGLTSAKVYVRGLVVQAEIGVYEHEHGRRQPLVVDVELELEPGPFEHIADTVNYETVAERAREIAAAGHLKLVETFAERLARACLADRRVRAARVRVDKPEALAPAVAGVEVRVERG